MKYQFIKGLTSDVVFEAFGKDLVELFVNAAEAMAEVYSQVEKIKPTKEVKIEVEGEDAKDLLFEWLQNIIALVDTEEIFFTKFEIEEISETKLKAKLLGEEITPEKGRTLVKAITYHQFDLQKTKEGYKATVSMDI